MTTAISPIRLSKDEIEVLKKSLRQLDENAKLYLFGSRIYPQKKGGDIDLLILSDILNRQDLRTIRLTFFNHFGEQKLDIVLDAHKIHKPFTKHILTQVVAL